MPIPCHFTPVFGIAALVTAFMGGPIEAQVVQSERGTLSQTIDGTTISLDYGRPRMKGRGDAIEDVVEVGDHRWTPGADWATILSSNRPFTLEGRPIPEGRWSVWIDLEPDDWTLILNPSDSIFHYPSPPDHPDQIEIPIQIQDGPFIETLQFSIPRTRISGFDLHLNWGRTEVSLEIRVDPSFATTVDRSTGDSLVGSYRISSTEEGSDFQNHPFDVFWEGDHLAMRTVDEFTGRELYGWLLPRGPDFFWLGEVRDGAVFDIEVDQLFETVWADDGSVAGFDGLWGEDEVFYLIRREDGPGG